MIFFKSAVTGAKPSLKMKVHAAISGVETPRSHNPIHASDLTKPQEFCPREYALMDATKSKGKGQFVGTSQRMTFDVGDAYSDLFRAKWARDIAVGTWECQRCGHIHPFCKHPASCRSCKNDQFKYVEEQFISGLMGATGSLDMLADMGMPKLVVVELKSMDKDEFKTLLMPKAEHSLRTNLYLRMVADSNHHMKHKINTSEGLIMYISKSFGFKDTSIKEKGIKDTQFSPLKEFYITRNDEDTQYLWDRAKILHRFRAHKGPMPKGICPTGLVKRAQTCNMCAQCWSGKFPSGI